jgi:predicted Rossmann fold nucleotide-binding protein DprA/Smf involved in DNA uptake
MSERVAIVGAREHPRLDLVREYVRSMPPGTVVVSGGAAGVDRVAEATAVERGLRVVSYRLVHPHGTRSFFAIKEIEMTRDESERLQEIRLEAVYDARTALIFRNTLIALSDRSVVFPDGSRGGSYDEADQAVRFKRPVELRWVDGRVEAYRRRR